MSDNFLREVQDDLRQERLQKIWKKYGLYIVAVPVLIVAVVAGNELYNYWRTQQAGESGDRFAAAVEKAEADETGTGLQDLRAIIEDGSEGYQILARFRLAAQLASTGQLADALKEYDMIVAEANRQPVKDIANIRAALLLVDAGDVSSVTDRVGAMAVPSHEFRHIAREILGLVNLANGDKDAAMKWISDALQERPLLSQTAQVRLSAYQAQLISEGIVDPNTAEDAVATTDGEQSAAN